MAANFFEFSNNILPTVFEDIYVLNDDYPCEMTYLTGEAAKLQTIQEHYAIWPSELQTSNWYWYIPAVLSF